MLPDFIKEFEEFKQMYDGKPFHLHKFFSANDERYIAEEYKINVLYLNQYLTEYSNKDVLEFSFALKYPERLSKLILADPAGIETFSRGQGDWLKSVITVAGIKLTTEEGVRKNLSLNFYTWNDKLEWMVEERVRMAKADDFDGFCYATVRSVHAMLDQPTSDKLKDIQVPTLIIYGKEDGLIPNPYLNPGFPCDVFETGAKLIPDCKLAEIEDSGHMVMMEQPEKFDEAVLNFLK